MEKSEKTMLDRPASAPPLAAAHSDFAAAAPRYAIEICRNGKIVSRLNVGKTEAIVGRGSALDPVDIRLADDAKISRVHAVLRIDENDCLWVTALGTRPTSVAGVVLPRNATIECPNGGAIAICGYELKFQVINQKRDFPQIEFLAKAMAATAEPSYSD